MIGEEEEKVRCNT